MSKKLETERAQALTSSPLPVLLYTINGDSEAQLVSHAHRTKQAYDLRTTFA